MEAFKYEDGATVWVGNIVDGRWLKGVIKGAATTPMWGIGRMWIVECPEVYSPTYPYSVISVPENALTERIIIRGD